MSSDGGPKKLVLTVIDAMKPAMLDRAVATGPRARAAAADRARRLRRRLRRGVPVRDAGVRGQHRHRRRAGRAPHPVDELVPPGRGALRRVRHELQGVADVRLQALAHRHDLQHEPRAPVLQDLKTVFETLDDEDVRTAGTTYLMYRGRHRHEVTNETALTRLASTVFRHAVYGPREFFYADIFASRKTGCRSQLGLPGVRDQHAGCVGAHLVEHDLFDFLLLSLPDNDTHSHRNGPFAQVSSIAAADKQIERLMHAAGRPGRVPRGPRDDRALGPLAVPGRAGDRPLQGVRRVRPRAAGAVACAPRRRAARDRGLPVLALGAGLRARPRPPGGARAADRAHRARARGRRPRHAPHRPSRRRGGDPRAAAASCASCPAARWSTCGGSAGASRATSTSSTSRSATARSSPRPTPTRSGACGRRCAAAPRPRSCCRRGRATSSPTGAATTTSAAARTGRCTPTTRSGRCCGAGQGPTARRPAAVVAARRRADGARALRRARSVRAALLALAHPARARAGRRRPGAQSPARYDRRRRGASTHRPP